MGLEPTLTNRPALTCRALIDEHTHVIEETPALMSLPSLARVGVALTRLPSSTRLRRVNEPDRGCHVCSHHHRAAGAICM